MNANWADNGSNASFDSSAGSEAQPAARDGIEQSQRTEQVFRDVERQNPVSYTHLTLPTIYSV